MGEVSGSYGKKRRDSHLPQKATSVLLTNSLSSQQNI